MNGENVARGVFGLARAVRLFAAIALLVVGARLAWVSGMALVPDSDTPTVRYHKVPGEDEPPDPRNPLEFDARKHRPDLAEIKKMMGADGKDTEMGADGISSVPQKSVRRLFVDVGPPRSKVFVNSKYVGRTPFGGQVVCADEELVKIQVLPEKGMPLELMVKCIGRQMRLEKDVEGPLSPSVSPK